MLHANAMSLGDTTSTKQNQNKRSYIDPFQATMEYVAMTDTRSPEPLALPASWEYANGKRCVAIGDNIVCIRRVPPRSAWKPSL